MAITQTSDSAPSAPVVLEAGDGPDVALPDGFAVSAAEYARAGSDLILTAADGTQVVVRGFFDADSTPDLTAGDGVRIAAETAARLAASPAAGQVAQAVPLAEADDSIGIVDTVEGPVRVTRADGTTEALGDGDPLFLGDVIATGPGAALGVILADDTTFSMGEEGRMTLDELVYDPGTQEGSAVLSLLQGTAVFVSGQIAKTDPEAMTLATPVGTIGIRGTSLAVGWDGTDFTLINMPEVAPDGSVVVGEIAFFSPTGEFYGVLSAGNSGWRWTPAAGGRPQVTQFTDDDVQDFAGGLMGILPLVEGGNRPAAAEDQFDTAAGEDDGGADVVGEFVQTQIGGAGDDALGPIVVAPLITPPTTPPSGPSLPGGGEEESDAVPVDPTPDPGPAAGQFGAEWLVPPPWDVDSSFHLGKGGYGVHMGSEGDAMVTSGVTLQIGSDASGRDASAYAYGDVVTYGTIIVTDLALVGGADDIGDNDSLSVVSNGRLDVDGALHINQDDVLVDHNAAVNVTGVLGIFDGAYPEPGVTITGNGTVTNSGLMGIQGSDTTVEVDEMGRLVNQGGGTFVLVEADLQVFYEGILDNAGDFFALNAADLDIEGSAGSAINSGFMVLGDNSKLRVFDGATFTNTGTVISLDQDLDVHGNGTIINRGQMLAANHNMAPYQNGTLINDSAGRIEVSWLNLGGGGGGPTTVTNAGVMTASFSDLTIASNAHVTNLSSGTINVITDDVDVHGILDNFGTIVVGDDSTGSGNFDVNSGGVVNNNGTITVAATLTVDAGGAFNNFGTLDVGDLDYAFGTFFNSGTLIQHGGVQDLRPGLDAGPGEIGVSDDATVTDFTNVGIVYVKEDLIVSNDFTNNTGGEFFAHNNLDVGGTLLNNGLVQVDDIGEDLDRVDTLINNGDLTSDGTIYVTNDVTNTGFLFFSAMEIGSGSLLNTASGVLAAGTDLNAEGDIDNYGDLNVADWLSSGSGNIFNRSGATMFSGDQIRATHPGSDIENYGIMMAGNSIRAGEDVLNNDTMIADNDVKAGGDLVNGSGARMTAGDDVEVGHELTNYGQMIAHESIWGDMGLTNEGTMIAGDGVWSDEGSVVNSSSGVLLVGGTVDAETGFYNYNIADILSDVVAESGGLLNDTGAQMTVGDSITVRDAVTNRGTFTTGGSVETTIEGDFRNESGATALIGGNLNSDEDVINQGTLTVDAGIFASDDVSNSGTLQTTSIGLGGSLFNSGSIALTGGIDLTDETHSLQFGDANQSFDVGHLGRDGILQLHLDSSVTPTAGQSFVVYEAITSTGNFDRIDGLVLASDGLMFDPLFDADNDLTVTLRTINSSSGGNDYLVGTGGNDTLVGGSSGGDVLIGLDGNDNFFADHQTFHYISGGDGLDRLFLDSDLDLTSLHDQVLEDIESIDISGTAGNTIDLDVFDLMAATDTNNTLYIGQNSGDTVNIADLGTDWTPVAPGPGDTFDIDGDGTVDIDEVFVGYTHDTEDATVYVQVT